MLSKFITKSPSLSRFYMKEMSYTLPVLKNVTSQCIDLTDPHLFLDPLPSDFAAPSGSVLVSSFQLAI